MKMVKLTDIEHREIAINVDAIESIFPTTISGIKVSKVMIIGEKANFYLVLESITEIMRLIS